MGRKYIKPKCPTCRYALRYVSLINYSTRIRIGYYCPYCKTIKLNPDIKLIHDPIFKGLNEVVS